MTPSQFTLSTAILTAVRIQFRIAISDLTRRDRSWHLVWARQLAAFLLRRDAKLTLDEIGAILDRDHSAIWNTLRSCENRLATSAKDRADLATLESKLDRPLIPSLAIA